TVHAPHAKFAQQFHFLPAHALFPPPSSMDSPAGRDVRCSALECVLRSFDEPELLYPPAPVRLGNIDVAFGIHRQCVTVSKITELVAGTAEGGQDLSCSMVERVNLLVAAVHYVHEFLILVSRETDPPCGATRVR